MFGYGQRWKRKFGTGHRPGHKLVEGERRRREIVLFSLEVEVFVPFAGRYDRGVPFMVMSFTFSVLVEGPAVEIPAGGRRLTEVFYGDEVGSVRIL